MMVSLKMQYEMARLMQEYESIQLAISHVLGGEVVRDGNPPNRSGQKVDGTEIKNMEGLISAFRTIGGKIGD